MNSERSIPPQWENSAKYLRKIYEATPYFRGKWQIFNILGRRVRWKGYETEIFFDKGQRIALNVDDWIPYQIFLTGFYAIEYLHTQYFRNIVREGMVFFDVGANIGYYTIQAAARVGDNGGVYSFEPVRSTFEKLQKNILINSFRNVSANRLIIYEKECEMEIMPGDNGNTGSAKIPPKGVVSKMNAEKVKAVTLDGFVEKKGVEKIDLIKIDVEGSELSVLRGMKNILEKMSPRLLIELTENTLKAHGTSCREVLQYLKDSGYFPYNIRRGKEKKMNESAVARESLALFRKESKDCDS